MMLAKTFGIALSVMATGFCVVGCTTAPKTEAAKETLDDSAEMATAKMVRTTPGLKDVLDKAYGYAIFPNAGSGGLIVGGKFGRGEVFEQGKFIGYAKVEEGTIGAQIGGAAFNELIVFQDDATMARFKQNKWTPTATAEAVILKAGAAVTTAFKDGVMILIDTEGGAKAGATVGAQKFTFQPAEKRVTDKE